MLTGMFMFCLEYLQCFDKLLKCFKEYFIWPNQHKVKYWVCSYSGGVAKIWMWTVLYTDNAWLLVYGKNLYASESTDSAFAIIWNTGKHAMVSGLIL